MKLMYQSYRASHMNQTSVMMSNIPKIPAIAPMLRMKTGVVTKLGSALHQIMVVWQQLTIARPNTHEMYTSTKNMGIYTKFGKNGEQFYALRLFPRYATPSRLHIYI